MMADTKRQVPNLRFKGFTDDWEQRKLGKVACINPKTNIPDNFKYVDLESVVGTSLIKAKLTTKQLAPSRAQRVAKKGDIFYQTVRPYQKNNFLFDINNYDFQYVFSTGYAQLRSEINNYFLFSYLQRQRFVNLILRRSTGTSYPAISSKDLSEIKIIFPRNSKEQENIGKIINLIDALITLQQRKLKQLKQLKKAMLQQLFVDKNSKQPNLRFKNFNSDWKQRKLKNISKRILRKNSDLQSLLPLTISAQDGLVDQTLYFNKQVASKQLKNYLLLYNGDFAYNKSYSVGYPYGAIKRLDKYKQGVLSTLYIAFKPTNINSDFLQHYYNTDKWYREIYRNAAEGARNHGLLNISANDFFNSKLVIPSDNDEQLKIAKIINLFNHLITLRQDNLTQLTILKKYLLQKLFI